MALNLHTEVRGAINTVNPDILATYKQSTGYTTASDGKQAPTYTTFTKVRIQVQALSWGDLQHRDMQNVQGVLRAIYMYGNTQGVVRPDVKGGDLLVFSQVLNGSPQMWLVKAVLETWTPDAPGFCKLGAVLQVGS